MIEENIRMELDLQNIGSSEQEEIEIERYLSVCDQVGQSPSVWELCANKSFKEDIMI